MMEGLGYILLGILAIMAPTLAVMTLCGVFKVGGVISTYLDFKIVEMKNKRKKLEER